MLTVHASAGKITICTEKAHELEIKLNLFPSRKWIELGDILYEAHTMPYTTSVMRHKISDEQFYWILQNI